jgi:diphthine synthase
LGELVFIGLGLHDELGLSLRGQAEARSCAQIFVEFYTSVMPCLSIENLSKIIGGKKVQVLSRADVEEKAKQIILSKAKVGKVGFLVPGDPMTATTHVDLRLRAHRAGIRTRIIHAASVMTAAAGVTGLQSYKFGRTVTIPVTWQGGFPDSVLDAIKGNLGSNLHSLVLLEVDIENNQHITIPQALRQLLDACKQKSETAISPETLAVGIARLEAQDTEVKAGTVTELIKTDFGRPPFVIILPAHLHFVEEEALQAFCNPTQDLMERKV